MTDWLEKMTPQQKILLFFFFLYSYPQIHHRKFLSQIDNINEKL